MLQHTIKPGVVMKMNLPVLTVSIALILSGCASTGDTTDKALSERVTEEMGNTVSWLPQSDSAVRTASLDQLLPVEAVQALVDEAIAHNPGLQQTLITLKQSKIRETSANASRLPQASASLSGNNSENSDTSYSASVNVSWEIDIWNRIGDSVDAAAFTTRSNAAALQSARATLAASVMQGYLDIISQQKSLDIEKKKLAALENSESIILNRYRTGLGTLADLDTARTSSATSRANIAEYENNLASSKRALAVLLGRSDMSLADVAISESFPDVVLPLAALPEQDLARRPDLMAAYYQIKANESSEKVAYKQLLPSLNITAALSDSGTTPALSLFKDPVWSLLSSITAPLFQGGELRANIALAELDTLNSWWNYQDTLLTAVQEVQATLDLENSYQRRQQHISQAYSNSRRSQDNYTSQYRQGLSDILDLLSVTQTTYSLEAQLVQLQRNQLSNRIDLGLALGLGVSS